MRESAVRGRCGLEGGAVAMGCGDGLAARRLHGGSGLLNTGIKVIHHELSEVQPDYSSSPPCVLCRVAGGAWEVRGRCAGGAWEVRGRCARRGRRGVLVCGTSLRGEAMACGTPLCCSPVDLDALPISARARRGLLDLGERSAWSLDLGLYMDTGGGCGQL